MTLFNRKKLALYAVVLVGFLYSNAGVAQVATGYDDAVVFGNPLSCEAHHFRAGKGSVSGETLNMEVGTLKDQFEVLTVSGKGAKMGFNLHVNTPGKPAILEVQEVHNRRPDVFGYTVLANGKEIYFRTFEETAAAPIHYFVEISPELMQGKNTVRITFRNESDAPFSISRLWLYSDFFDGLAQQEQVYRKMPILSVNSEKIKEEMVCYEPMGHLTETFYVYPDQARGNIDRTFEKIAQNGRTHQFVFCGTGWGAVPIGPDGEGGYLHDLKYSQRRYNPRTGTYLPSFPNLWSSSMWTTLGDPRLDRALRETFADVAGYFTDKLQFLAAQDKLPESPLYICRELGLGIDNAFGGDYHPNLIRAAKEDGVELNPEDGLGMGEKLWMFHFVTDVFRQMDGESVEGFGRNPVQVDRGKIKLPSYQVIDNMYAHTLPTTPLYTLRDRRWMGWQAGVQEFMFSSGEFYSGSLPWFGYMAALGKLGMVNQEDYSLSNDFTRLKHFYQSGFQFFVLYTGKDIKYNDFFRDMDRCDHEPSLPAPHFAPIVFDSNRDGLIEGDHVVQLDNLRILPVMNGVVTSPKLLVQGVKHPGVVTYRLANNGEGGLSSDLLMKVHGRISAGEGNRIEVWLGKDPRNLERIKTLTHEDLPYPKVWTLSGASTTEFPLGKNIKEHGMLFIRFVFYAEKETDAAFLVQDPLEKTTIQVTGSWAGKTSGHSCGNPFNMRQKRILNLWVQDRSMARRQLRHYEQLGGRDAVWEKANRLYEAGYYRSAGKLLTGEVSQLLPATYSLRGHGRLGRYPVALELADENSIAVFRLLEMDKGRIEFSVKTETHQSCEIIFSGLPPGMHYSIQSLEQNHYLFAPETDGAVKAGSNGDAIVKLVLEPFVPSRKKLPRKLVARYLDGRGDGFRVDLQELELAGLNGELVIPLSDDVKLSRLPDEQSAGDGTDGPGQWPQKFDRVELTLSEQREIETIQATYGVVEGRIKSYQPMNFSLNPCQGIIELDNGKAYELDFANTVCDTPFLTGVLRNYEPVAINAAFKVGEKTRLTYSPYTFKGSLPRILNITQPYKVVLDIDYTKETGDSWKDAALKTEGLTHGKGLFLQPSKPFTPGYVTYKVKNDQPFGRTVLKFYGRAYEDSTRMEFLVSRDNRNWVKVGQFDNTWQNHFSYNGGQQVQHTFEITEQVRGRRSFYLKTRITRNADDTIYNFSNLWVVTATE